MIENFLTKVMSDNDRLRKRYLEKIVDALFGKIKSREEASRVAWIKKMKDQVSVGVGDENDLNIANRNPQSSAHFSSKP